MAKLIFRCLDPASLIPLLDDECNFAFDIELGNSCGSTLSIATKWAQLMPSRMEGDNSLEDIRKSCASRYKPHPHER